MIMKIITTKTAELLNAIVERVSENIREGKPSRYIHLNSVERGIVAPVLVFRLQWDRRVPTVLGLEIKPGIGGVFVTG